MADVRRRAEITKADIDRVDAVDEPATGIPFLMLKAQADPNAADPANVPEGIAKADGETAEAGGQSVDVEDPAANGEPGSGPWEAVDAAKAREAVEGLLAVRALLGFLTEREGAEGEGDEVWGLMDAQCAVDCALAQLAVFAATEQQEADLAAASAEAEARALGLIKTLYPPTEEEPAVAAEPTKAELLKSLEADTITKAAEGGIEDPTLMGLFVRKAQNEDLPTGVIDLLNQIVAVMNAIDDVSSGVSEAAASPVDTGEGEQPEPEAVDQPDAPADGSPIEDAMDGGSAPDGDQNLAPEEHDVNPAVGGSNGTEGEDGEAKPNPFAKSNEAGALTPEQVAKAQEYALAAATAERQAMYLAAADRHRAAHHLPPVAVAKAQEKTMEQLIAEAVANAVGPLQKRITELEETPVETGVLLAGHVPGTPGANTGMGQATTAQADLFKAAAASGDPGKQTDAAVAAIMRLHGGGHA